MTEDDLEQLALTWFQDSGWECRHGPDIAPDGDTPERADLEPAVRVGAVVVTFALPLKTPELLLQLLKKVPELSLLELAAQTGALTWFQDTGWKYSHGPGIAPDGDECEFGKVLGAMKAEEK